MTSMDALQLRTEIEALQAKAAPGSTLQESSLKRLFEAYRSVENELERWRRGGDIAEGRADQLTDTQSLIIRIASNLRADSPAGILYKLALWRWDAAEIDPPVDDMMRCEAIAYSAFRDLAGLLNIVEVLRDQDKITSASAEDDAAAPILKSASDGL